jgi:hypothetical protein
LFHPELFAFFRVTSSAPLRLPGGGETHKFHRGAMVMAKPHSRPCMVCQQPIDPERLEVVPETRLCVEHAREILKYGGEFLSIVSRERTSKEGSLKKNYGSVNVERTRNHRALNQLLDAYHGQTQE